tara:strand:- start:361 stop:519 length:159 start_codon:yes stop_codon:yes gene_type:complete
LATLTWKLKETILLDVEVSELGTDVTLRDQNGKLDTGLVKNGKEENYELQRK